MVATRAAQRMADVVSLPIRSAAGPAGSAIAQVRAWTANEVDDWGRDNGMVNRLWAASKVRWDTSVGGADHVPKRAGALIIVNARRLALAPAFAALAIGAEVDRPVRFVGRPDIAPLGPLMQRFGALLPITEELEGALRAGELVVLGTAHRHDNESAGYVDHHLVGAAVAAGVRVLPAATKSSAVRRSARVEIGKPIRRTRPRRGPLEELELADEARERIDALLDEMGVLHGATPFDLLAAAGARIW